jgi:hypothetical protein
MLLLWGINIKVLKKEKYKKIKNFDNERNIKLIFIKKNNK